MRFEYPELLWLLLLTMAALAAFFVWSWRKRRALIAQFVQSRLLAQLTVGVSSQRQKIRLVLLGVSVALVLLVLARPQWGFDWEEAKQRGLDIVVAIDTSKSMLAEDIRPNRLERAKLSAMDLKKLARADRLGLVAFSGSAFLQCPLTTDDEPFRQSINALDVTIIPQGGTALTEAIQCALGAFKEKSDNHKVLVLFTDGEDHDGNALEAARSAAKDGLRIFTVGVGTPKGELLSTRDTKGRIDYIKDAQGQVVMSKLNEELLRQVASAANGFYLQLAGADTMDLLYERGLAPLPKAEFSSRRVQRWHERYQWFLGLTLVLLLIEMFLPERKAVRRSEEIVSGGANEPLRKAVSVLIFLLLLPGGALGSSTSAKKQYDAGRYEVALREYQRLLQKKPNDARLLFNVGTTAFQAQKYEEARDALKSSIVTADILLQQRAYYNLGNAYYRLGEQESDLVQRLATWQEAITCYENALQLDPSDADARFNLDFAKQKLDEVNRILLAIEQAKKAADESLHKRQYRAALNIMMQQFQKDSTNTSKYEEYTDRLGKIEAIVAPERR